MRICFLSQYELAINQKIYNIDDALKDKTILQVCDQLEIKIPRFCYHEFLNIAGNCRMCLVEPEKNVKPVIACATPLSPNMCIYTETASVKKARENVLEFILKNHPLDCPICDQGGECDLQEYTRSYGIGKGRFYKKKRGVQDKELGPIIKTIMTRCIQCTRCVRFSTLYTGKEVLGAFGRGESMEIGAFINKFIKSEFSGNLVDLCPVGALTAKPYSFLNRPWELQTYESFDFSDCLGTEILIQTKNRIIQQQSLKKSNLQTEDTIVRILPRHNLNKKIENWISDRTRFFFTGYFSNKLTKIKKKKYNRFNKTYSTHYFLFFIFNIFL